MDSLFLLILIFNSDQNWTSDAQEIRSSPRLSVIKSSQAPARQNQCRNEREAIYLRISRKYQTGTKSIKSKSTSRFWMRLLLQLWHMRNFSERRWVSVAWERAADPRKRGKDTEPKQLRFDSPAVLPVDCKTLIIEVQVFDRCLRW